MVASGSHTTNIQNHDFKKVIICFMVELFLDRNASGIKTLAVSNAVSYPLPSNSTLTSQLMILWHCIDKEPF